MSYLFLDSRFTEEAGAWWVEEGTEEVWQAAGRAQSLLKRIAQERSRLSETLEGVCVVAGPGRFSALRVGILYAHVLARWYRVSLYVLSPEDVETAERRQEVIRAIASGVRAAVSYVAPLYDREPTITTPRI